MPPTQIGCAASGCASAPSGASRCSAPSLARLLWSLPSKLCQRLLDEGAAARLENLPILLTTVHCYAECQVHAGDVRGAVALWLFIIAHPQTTLSGGVPSCWQTARRYPMKTTHGPYSRRNATS